jgi:hypothetical protein
MLRLFLFLCSLSLIFCLCSLSLSILFHLKMLMVVKMVKMGSIDVQLDYYLGFIGDSWILFFLLIHSSVLIQV